jgi:hypothetical protein
MSAHDGEHHLGSEHPPHPRNAPLSDLQLRVRALESLPVDKGLVDPAALDELIDTYETRVGRVEAPELARRKADWAAAASAAPHGKPIELRRS